MRSIADLLSPKVYAEMNEALCASYSTEKLKEALFQMYPTKAPRPDGMPHLFFQHYWEVVGQDVVVAVRSFLHSTTLLGEVNFTHIWLILKIDSPTRFLIFGL